MTHERAEAVLAGLGLLAAVGLLGALIAYLVLQVVVAVVQ